ncbi:hypothetical protein OSK51_28540, partial [Escherichia coli]|nr:hypothetical protein [Escherichia coli]
MDYLFLHRDKRTFTSERQKNLLFRAARLYWEQKYEGREPEKAKKLWEKRITENTTLSMESVQWMAQRINSLLEYMQYGYA